MGRKVRSWRLRGKAWRQPAAAVAFQVQVQRQEGDLWRRLYVGGAPLALPLSADLAALTAAVGALAGWYVLVPVDVAGVQAGDVLDVVVIGDAHKPRTPTAATRMTLDDLDDEVADPVGDDADHEIQTS